MDCDSVSKSEWAGTRHGWQHGDLLEFPDSPQKLLYLLPFEFELVVVSDMLIVAPSAMTKIFADWVNPIRRRNNHSAELGPIEPFASFNYFCGDLLSIDCERDKNSLTVHASDPFATKRNVMN
jgi:hypothetical protein